MYAMTYQIGVINMHERVGSQAPQAFDYFYAIGCPIAIFVKYFVSYWEYIHLIQVNSDSIKSVLRNIIYGIDSILGILIFFFAASAFQVVNIKTHSKHNKNQKSKIQSTQIMKMNVCSKMDFW